MAPCPSTSGYATAYSIEFIVLHTVTVSWYRMAYYMLNVMDVD